MKATAFSSTVRHHRLVMAAAMIAMITMIAARTDASIINVAAAPGSGGNTVRTSDGNDGTGTWIGDGSGSTWTTFTDGGFTGTSPVLTSETVNFNTSVNGTAPALTMTVSGLPSGLYNVYVIYQTDDTATGDQPGGSTPFPNAAYNMQAGLSAGSLSVFDDTNGGYTGGHRLISGGPRSLNERRVLVGTESGTSVSLFIGDYTGLPSGHDNETRWEGLAYEQIPEPSTLALALVGGLLTCGRRSSRA